MLGEIYKNVRMFYRSKILSQYHIISNIKKMNIREYKVQQILGVER